MDRKNLLLVVFNRLIELSRIKETDPYAELLLSKCGLVTTSSRALMTRDAVERTSQELARVGADQDSYVVPAGADRFIEERVRLTDVLDNITHALCMTGTQGLRGVITRAQETFTSRHQRSSDDLYFLDRIPFALIQEAVLHPSTVSNDQMRNVAAVNDHLSFALFTNRLVDEDLRHAILISPLSWEDLLAQGKQFFEADEGRYGEVIRILEEAKQGGRLWLNFWSEDSCDFALQMWGYPPVLKEMLAVMRGDVHYREFARLKTGLRPVPAFNLTADWADHYAIIEEEVAREEHA